MNYSDWKRVYIDQKISLREWQNQRDGGKINIPRGLAAGNNVVAINEKGTPPRLIGQIELSDTMRVIDYFEKRIVTAKVENAIVITRAGEVYHCTGELNTLETIEKLEDKLIGATVTHNHPVGSANEYTFSEGDISLFQKYSLERLRGVDEFFVYELTQNAEDIDKLIISIEAMSDWKNYRHWDVIRDALSKRIGYRRWRRE